MARSKPSDTLSPVMRHGRHSCSFAGQKTTLTPRQRQPAKDTKINEQACQVRFELLGFGIWISALRYRITVDGRGNQLACIARLSRWYARVCPFHCAVQPLRASYPDMSRATPARLCVNLTFSLHSSRCSSTRSSQRTGFTSLGSPTRFRWARFRMCLPESSEDLGPLQRCKGVHDLGERYLTCRGSTSLPCCRNNLT